GDVLGAPRRTRRGDGALRYPHGLGHAVSLRSRPRGSRAEPGRLAPARVLRGHPRRDQARGGRGRHVRLRDLVRQLHPLALPDRGQAHAAAHRAVRVPEVLVRSHGGGRLRLRHRGRAPPRPRHPAAHGTGRVRRLLSPMPPRPVSLDEIESIAVGAWILGTGGGGSPYLALLNLRRLYREGTVVSLMDPAELADDDRVAVVSN